MVVETVSLCSTHTQPYQITFDVIFLLFHHALYCFTADFNVIFLEFFLVQA